MTETPWLDDTQQKAWRALTTFVNRALPEIERSLKAHDLLAVHYSIFVSLSEAPDDSLRLADLAEEANLSQSRLTHRLRSLVDRGLVDVTPCPDDDRGKNATLTSAGRQLLETIAPVHAAHVKHLVFDHLNPAETAALAASMTKVADALRQPAEPT